MYLPLKNVYTKQGFKMTCSWLKNSSNMTRFSVALNVIFGFTIVIYLVIYLITGRSGSTCNCMNCTECNCERGGTILAQTQENQLALILDWKESLCEYPVCIHKNIEFKGPSVIQQTPKECPEESELKNSSCFLCENECYSYDEIKLKNGIAISCKRHITCCLISDMGNLNDVCGEHGRYGCFTKEVLGTKPENEPICKCEPGFEGDWCETENKFELQCRCFYDEFKLAHEDELKECGDTLDPNQKFCSMKKTYEYEKYNCLCNTTDATGTK